MIKTLKNKTILISIVAFLALAAITIANVPSPPVNQNMGVYDTLLGSLAESNCRGCHGTDVSGQHHNLVENGTINRYTGQIFGCQDCHPVVNNTILLVRNCIQCHNNTFNGMNIRRPHHESQFAVDRHCSACHGSLVNDYDDGHYIPTYPTDNMTPDSSFKVINQTSGKKWGGCESCHESNLSASPLPIYDNNNTHHRLGNLSGFRNNDTSKCEMCHGVHNGTYEPDSIRYCENCHGYASLHNIQWDLANTSQTSGYGHLGPNDCQGCHASYVAGSVPPDSDIIVPTIDSVNDSTISENYPTVLVINGHDFVTNMTGVNRTSVIELGNGSNNITVIPTKIDQNHIVVTIPPMSRGLYKVSALKAGVVSNNRPMISIPEVMLTARKINTSTVNINGSGFGVYNPAYNNWTNVTITRGGAYRSLQIVSWSDTSIYVTSPTSRTGDTLTVNSFYGTNSTTITS